MDGPGHNGVLSIRSSNGERTSDLPRIRLQPMICMAHLGQIDILELELGFDRRALTWQRCARVRRTNTGTEATVQSGKADFLWANPKFAVTASKRQIEATPAKRKRFAGMDLD